MKKLHEKSYKVIDALSDVVNDSNKTSDMINEMKRINCIFLSSVDAFKYHIYLCSFHALIEVNVDTGDFKVLHFN